MTSRRWLAIVRGKHAGRLALPLSSNPYRADTLEAMWWFDGHEIGLRDRQRRFGIGKNIWD
jgi:hypothetical protein